MGYGATFGILGGHGPPPKSAYELPLRNRTDKLTSAHIGPTLNPTKHIAWSLIYYRLTRTRFIKKE